jgi:hypothetical protein
MATKKLKQHFLHPYRPNRFIPQRRPQSDPFYPCGLTGQRKPRQSKKKTLEDTEPALPPPNCPSRFIPRRRAKAGPFHPCGLIGRRKCRQGKKKTLEDIGQHYIGTLRVQRAGFLPQFIDLHPLAYFQEYGTTLQNSPT